MLVWCTGISGSGRTDYLLEAAEAVRASGKTAEVIDIGKLLDTVPPNLRVGTNGTELLDGNEDVLRLHRAYALHALEVQIANSNSDVIFVSTHAVFMRKGRLIAALDMNFIRQHLAEKIDAFATVIHDTHVAWTELQARPEWRDHLGLEEVALWRDFEIVTTKMLAEYHDKPFYLLARRDPASGLAGLVAVPPKPSLYLSYPITAILQTQPELLDQANGLADKLRDAGFVVFNPLSIKDVPGTRAALEGADSEITGEMEEEARPYIEAQTISRDLQLIDQADMVVVYYPTDRVSPGVFTEMSHARDRRKPVHLCAFPGRISPFLGLFHQHAYASIEEMIPALQAQYGAA